MSQTTTQTAVNTPSVAVAVIDPASLPVDVTTKITKEGDLINVKQLSADQVAKAREVVKAANLADTMFVLTFAAAPQQELSKYLDELMKGIKVKDTGTAGDIAKQLAAGIDLMNLAKVKEQISGGKGFMGKIAHALHGWTNYVLNFYQNQKEIGELVAKIEAKAGNHIKILDGDSKKLDNLVGRSEVQVRSLASWILAGEMILLEARRQYQAKREEVLESKDPLEAARLRDMARQLAAFEQRLLETQIAYVEAASATIPRVRSVQESIRIEIQNLSEQILFQIPKFKTAIVLVAALHDTKAARDQRTIMEDNQRKLDGVLDDTINETARLAKESQGDALLKVQALEKTIESIEKGIQQGIELEKISRGQRDEAFKLLVGLKDRVTEALKKSDFVAAEQGEAGA